MVSISETDSISDADAVTAILVAYNRQFVPGKSPVPLRLVVRGDDGSVQGGALGYIVHDWCYIDILTLSAPRRGTGLGRDLLSAIETAARAKGCIGVYLFSYSFQAPEFYRKHGYIEFGHIEDLPQGHTQVWLKKRFS